MSDRTKSLITVDIVKKILILARLFVRWHVVDCQRLKYVLFLSDVYLGLVGYS